MQTSLTYTAVDLDFLIQVSHGLKITLFISFEQATLQL